MIWGSRLGKNEHEGPTINVYNVHKSQIKSFVTCLSSLFSSWGVPVGWVLGALGALFSCQYAHRGLGFVPPAPHHAFLMSEFRVGLGQIQAVFVHVWHGSEIKRRRGQGACTSQESTMLLMDRPCLSQHGPSLLLPNLPVPWASPWRNKHLPHRSLMFTNNCYQMTYNYAQGKSTKNPGSWGTGQASCFSLLFPRCHYNYSFFFSCFSSFYYIENILLHGNVRIFLFKTWFIIE